MSNSTASEPTSPPSADVYETSEVALTDIRVFKRLRPLEPALVETLTASMKVEGLRHPIAVRRTPEGYHLILGRHRLEAARKLNWQAIQAWPQTKLRSPKSKATWFPGSRQMSTQIYSPSHRRKPPPSTGGAGRRPSADSSVCQASRPSKGPFYVGGRGLGPRHSGPLVAVVRAPAAATGAAVKKEKDRHGGAGP